MILSCSQPRSRCCSGGSECDGIKPRYARRSLKSLITAPVRAEENHAWAPVPAPRAARDSRTSPRQQGRHTRAGRAAGLALPQSCWAGLIPPASPLGRAGTQTCPTDWESQARLPELPPGSPQPPATLIQPEPCLQPLPPLGALPWPLWGEEQLMLPAKSGETAIRTRPIPSPLPAKSVPPSPQTPLAGQCHRPPHAVPAPPAWRGPNGGHNSAATTRTWLIPRVSLPALGRPHQTASIP